MDQLDFIMQVESEGFDPNDPKQAEAMEAMIASGLAWKLQGFWGRLARAYLDWRAQQEKEAG